jgi:hypothetical protein
MKIYLFLILWLSLATIASQAGPNFEDLESPGSPSNFSSRTISSRYKFDLNFWSETRTRLLEVSSLDEQFPPAAYPDEVDLRIRFDDQVVTSFSDHIVGMNIPMVYDLSYKIQDDKLRLTLLLDYEELSKLDVLAGLVDLDDATAQKQAGDIPLIGLDVLLKVFNREGEANSVFLAFDHLKTYRFWRDGPQASRGQKTNLDLFHRYIAASIKGMTRRSSEIKLQELTKQVQSLRANGDLNQAFKVQDEVDALREDRSFFQTVEEKFSSQVQFKPKFVGNLIQHLKNAEVFHRNLELSHYHITVGAEQSQKTIQLVKVSRLDRALEMALPELSITYVSIQGSQMVLTGKMAD